MFNLVNFSYGTTSWTAMTFLLKYFFLYYSKLCWITFSVVHSKWVKWNDAVEVDLYKEWRKQNVLFQMDLSMRNKNGWWLYMADRQEDII